MDLCWLENFINIVKYQGIVSAARHTGLAPSIMSKQLKKLEESLGKLLIARTSRQFNLTDAGRCYYEYALKIVGLQQEAATLVQKHSTKIDGEIRLGLPTPLLRLALFKQLPKFLQHYPEVKLVLVKGNSINTLLEQQADLVFTFSTQENNRVALKKVMDLHRIFVAAASYLENHVPLYELDDLIKHNCLVNTAACPNSYWAIHKQAVPVTGNLSAVSAELLIRMAVAGLGIINTFTELVIDELASQQLQKVFADNIEEVTPLYLAYRPSMLSKAGLKLLEFLINPY